MQNNENINVIIVTSKDNIKSYEVYSGPLSEIPIKLWELKIWNTATDGDKTRLEISLLDYCYNVKDYYIMTIYCSNGDEKEILFIPTIATVKECIKYIKKYENALFGRISDEKGVMSFGVNI